MVDLLKPGHITVPAGPDLLAADSVAKYTLGACVTVHDLFGERKFVYVKNQHGSAATNGQWLDRIAYPTEITADAAGTTTTIKDSTASWTVDDYVGMIAYCTDDAGGAGAAPEGQSSIVVENTATVITIHPDMPFTVATASSDKFGLYPLGHARLSDSDNNALAIHTFGVVMATSLGDNEYGWCQYKGWHPAVKVIVTAPTSWTTSPVHVLISTTAGAAVLGGADRALEAVVGLSVNTDINAGGDIVGLKMPCYISCWEASPYYVAGSP